jgi:hypothetical protein
LKRKLSGTPIKSTPVKNELVVEENKRENKTQRQWVTINDKIDKKAMDSIDVSLVKSDGQVDLEREMDKYLGGDDEVLEGFFNSDDEPEALNVAG